MAVWSRSVEEQRRDAAHPPEQGDVIDVDAALCEESLEVAIGELEAEVRANRQRNHFGREPEADKR